MIPLIYAHRSLSRNVHSGNGGQGGKGSGGQDKKVEKPANHNKGVGGSLLAGTRHKQVGPSADPYPAFGEGGSAQGGSVSGGGSGLINVLSGTLGPTRSIVTTE
jgi:hypothetical protein